MTVGIAAAGTGGHVFPALAVAEALVAAGLDPGEVVFFGGDRLEASAVPAAGFPLVTIKQRGFTRRLSIENLRAVRQVVGGARRVRREIRLRRIRAVLAMGGYITGPVAVAARLAHVPLLLHEQNADPGLANRLAARFADRVFVAFPAALERLPEAEVVGNPLRAALTGAMPPRRTAIERYGLDPDRPVVGVLGGSQGADALNQAAAELAGSDEFQLLHLAGPEQHEQWTSRAAGSAGWEVIPFESDMQFFYAAADLVVGRAGALTVSELGATGTPSILVPYPGAEGHQTANAAFLAETGAAVLLPQGDLYRLGEEIRAALLEGELARRAAAAAAHGRPDAADTVAAALMEAAGA